jgi:phospholipase C
MSTHLTPLRTTLLLAVIATTPAMGQAALGRHFVPPSHVMVVMEENHSYSEIIGSSDAPYINALAAAGALFTNSYAITHPSQPNYLDLFSGLNQGVTDDSCPHTFSTQNLESELIAAGKTFAGYSEGLPDPGSEVCSSGEYARKHVPWTNFTNDPAGNNLPFTSFPANFATLPTISWVIPDLLDDMHDGTIQEGDTWLETNLSPYVQWAQTHNSLLIVTWDEDDGSEANQIPTIFVGPMVKLGKYGELINHYNVLRTLEDMYGLPHLGNSSTAKPITDVWK